MLGFLSPSRSACPRLGPSRATALALGAALAYAQGALMALQPAIRCARQLPALACGLAHALGPLSGAWFASHWNVAMEQRVWAGPSWRGAIAFALLWTLSGALWSAAWLGAAQIARWAHGEFLFFAQVGRRTRRLRH